MFAKIIDFETLLYLKLPVYIDNEPITNPTKEQLNKLGYYEVDHTYPKMDNSYKYEFYWVVKDDKIVRDFKRVLKNNDEFSASDDRDSLLIDLAYSVTLLQLEL